MSAPAEPATPHSQSTAAPPGTAPVSITTAGVYDLPASVYHSDPVRGGSLSSSGAKLLGPKSCPALFRHWADNHNGGSRPSKALDIGTAAHAVVLVDAADWRTKAAKEQRDAAHLRGATPLLAHEYKQVRALADAVMADPTASRLFEPGGGLSEQSLFWLDDEFTVWRRAMLDRLPDDVDDNGYFVIPDLKTTRSVEPGSLARDMATFGYHQQAAWYIDGVQALGLAPPGSVAFLLVFVMKEPPYLVRTVQVHPDTVALGRRQNREALTTFRSCRQSGVWPGYGGDVTSLSLPGWARRDIEAALGHGDIEGNHP
jgi:hypothetical protein